VYPGAVKDLTTEEADLAMILARIVMEDDASDAEKDIAILEKNTGTGQPVPRLIDNSLQMKSARRASKDFLSVPDHRVIIQLLSDLHKIIVQIEWLLHANLSRYDSRCA